MDGYLLTCNIESFKLNLCRIKAYLAQFADVCSASAYTLTKKEESCVNLLHSIQKSIVVEQNRIAPILLQLRILATKIGSEHLEDWIKFESEGYPDNVKVPNYRKISISYLADFTGPFHAQIKNAPIPPYLIEKFAGKEWIIRDYKESISTMEHLISTCPDQVYIDASNLILLLRNKIYQHHNCVSVRGRIPIPFFIEIQNTVRNRILEFVIQLEKSIPTVADINFNHKIQTDNFADQKEKINQITNQTIYKDCTFAHSNHNSDINISIIEGNKSSLINFLIEKHFPIKEAEEFADIVASEKPTNKSEPFGKKTQQWLDHNLKKTSKLCQVITPILELVKKAVSAFYGI